MKWVEPMQSNSTSFSLWDSANLFQDSNEDDSMERQIGMKEAKAKRIIRRKHDDVVGNDEQRWKEPWAYATAPAWGVHTYPKKREACTDVLVSLKQKKN